MGDSHTLPGCRALVEGIMVDLALIKGSDLIRDEVATISDTIPNALETFRVMFYRAVNRLNSNEGFLHPLCVSLPAKYSNPLPGISAVMS